MEDEQSKTTENCLESTRDAWVCRLKRPGYWRWTGTRRVSTKMRSPGRKGLSEDVYQHCDVGFKQNNAAMSQSSFSSGPNKGITE